MAETTNTNPLVAAVKNKDLECVKRLLAFQYMPPWSGEDLNTALRDAVWNRCPEITHVLLEKGADPNARENDTVPTLLRIAAKNGDTSIVQDLVNHKADPNPKDVNGNTALTLAERGGYTDIVRILKAAGSP